MRLNAAAASLVFVSAIAAPVEAQPKIQAVPPTADATNIEYCNLQPAQA